jgi:hypothetical protein
MRDEQMATGGEIDNRSCFGLKNSLKATFVESAALLGKRNLFLLRTPTLLIKRSV